MAATYTDAHRNACCSAVTALGAVIGLYAGSNRVGTVAATTTWGAPAKATEGGYDWAKSVGSLVTLTVPAGTVANGTVVDGYGVHSGTTLLRRQTLPVALTVNDGSQSFQVDVTPVYRYRGE